MHVHQRADVADRTDVDLRAGEERHGAFEVDGEAALDLVEDHAFDALVLVVHFLELDPALFAAGLLAAEDGLAQGVLDAVDVDLDLGAHLDGAVTAGLAEFLERDAAFGLETDVDDREILLDGNDRAFDHGAFNGVVVDEAVHEERFEIFLRGSLQSEPNGILRLQPWLGVRHGRPNGLRSGQSGGVWRSCSGCVAEAPAGEVAWGIDRQGWIRAWPLPCAP